MSKKVNKKANHKEMLIKKNIKITWVDSTNTIQVITATVTRKLKLQKFAIVQKHVKSSRGDRAVLYVTNSSSRSLGRRIESRLGHGYVDVICNIITLFKY